jgi:hypothetical protein
LASADGTVKSLSKTLSDGASANESWPDLIFGQGRPPPLSRAFIWATFIPKIGGLTESDVVSKRDSLYSAAAFAVACAAWSIISPLSHQIQADFNLDDTSIGLLIALLTLLSALMRVPMQRAIAGIDSGLRWPDRCA